jgi:hypothetical protein
MLAMPTFAHFDTAATASMDVRFLKIPQSSNVGIEVYNSEVVRNSIEGTFVSHSAEGDLPDGERGYANPTLPTTPSPAPQVVFELPKQDVVLSVRHGWFMQPTSTCCPICDLHDKRINFNGGPAGFALEIFPGHNPRTHALRAHSLEDEGRRRNSLLILPEVVMTAGKKKKLRSFWS